MKPIPFPLRAFVVLGCLAALAVAQQPAVPPSGGLQRIAPGQEERAPRELDTRFARPFERAEWRERLGTPDLEQRERNLDVLLKRAQLDPAARAFLEELARDPQAGELAWTARLALRELGRARFPLQGLLSGPDSLGMAERMQQMMQEFMSQDGMGLLRPQGPPPSGNRAPHASSRNVHVEQSESGARVDVTETIDGHEQTTHYEGLSLDDILARNPQLAEQLDGLRIRAAPRSPLDLRFDLGRPREGLPGRDGALALQPQGRSRPVLTNRLGVVVFELGAETARELGLAEGLGLVVQQTSPGTYAHLLGVGTGDVLVELDGRPLRDPSDIEQAMRARKSEDPLTLVWIDELGQRQEKTWRPQDK
ncbi:MAG: PDZ domain-containing protein [Planctomycetes bacterium]|nr:PDZ domain-containing protein [Planctomycetota bacterium]